MGVYLNNIRAVCSLHDLQAERFVGKLWRRGDKIDALCFTGHNITTEFTIVTNVTTTTTTTTYLTKSRIAEKRIFHGGGGNVI